MAGEGEQPQGPPQPPPPPSPPPPFSPPPPQRPAPWLRPLAWAGGVAAVLGVAVLVALPHVGDENPAYILGQILGALTIAFLLAAAGRGLLVRLKAVPGPVFAPSLLYIAAAFGVVTVLLAAVGERNEEDERTREQIASCDTEAAEVLDRPPANGYVITPLRPSEEEQARGFFPPAVREELEFRAVDREGQRAAVVYALPGAKPAEITTGMMEGARERGDDPVKRSVALGPQVADYVEFTAQGQKLAAIVGSSGCVAFVVLGAEKRHVKPIAETIGAEH